MLLISIPKPCHEDWNKMSPNEQGAFCNVCSKTVIDFSVLSDEEVKNYFLSNRGQKTCGRFKNTQLSNSDNPLPALLAGNIPLWKKFLAIVVILFGSFLTGCKEQVVGKVAVPENEVNTVSVNKDNAETTATAEMMPEPPFVNVMPVEENIYSIKGGIDVTVFPEHSMIQGDVVVQPLPLIPDSMLNIKPEIQKTDSSKKVITGKDDCDSIQIKPSLFIDP